MSFILFPEAERGRSDLGWLQSRFSFSFADWYDPNKLGFGKLRVLNDDIIAGGQGFGFHPHANMEIVTIVLEGVVGHQDSLGNKAEVSAGEIQIMSAGTGIVHSEVNPTKEPLKLFQVWIYPKILNIKPRYQQKRYNLDGLKNKFEVLVAPGSVAEIEQSMSEAGSEAALVDRPLLINQESYFSLGNFEGGEAKYVMNKAGLDLYLMVIEGSIQVLGQTLSDRDAIGISQEAEISLEIPKPSKLLAIEVPRN